MKKTVLLSTLLVLLSFGVTAEVSPDLENQLDELGPNDRIEVLVQTRPSMTDQHVNSMSQQGELRNRFDSFDAVHLDLPVPAVEALSNLEFVESVEPNYEMEVSLGDSTSQVEADVVWENNRTGDGIETAVLDTGIHSDHSELDIIEQIDFTDEGTGDNNGHGTHVAGIIGSQDEINKGLAYNSDLYDVKVLNEEGQGSGSDLLNGMEWTIENNMQVAVLSLGAQVEECDGEDIISQAVDDMTGEGVFVTVAAGNHGPDGETITIPGCSREGTTVGSVDKNDAIADYSSRGPTADGRVKPDVVAPGTGIESTWNDGNYNTISGTSMATPHVAGQAAILLEEDSALSPEELKEIITSSSTDLGLESNEQGSGRINVSESFFQISDEEREEESEDESEEEQEDETEDDTEEETEEQNGSEDRQEARAEGRMRMGPDSMFYGLRIASDKAAVSLGIKTREEVMEQRAKEAKQMQESNNTRAAERAVREMRKTSGDSENATREAEETLDRVMQDSPEEAKEGLRNALRNVEEQRGPRAQGEQAGNQTQRPDQEEQNIPDSDERSQQPDQEEQRDSDQQDHRPDSPDYEDTERQDRSNENQRQETERTEEETQEEQHERSNQEIPEGSQEENTTENESQDQRNQQDSDNQRRRSNENQNESQDLNSSGQNQGQQSEGIGHFFRDNLDIF